MLTEKQMNEIKEALLSSEKPMFFFHDDADGVSSFLQFYKQANKGKGVVVKSTPRVDGRFISSVKSFDPDRIFVLDLAMVDQDFVDTVNKQIIWLDHHDLSEVKGTKYYNPKQNKNGSYTCISKLSYDIFKDNFWIAAVGTIGDWQLPEDVREKIMKDMPDLFDENIKTPEKALFETKLGGIAKIFNFVQKGEMKDVNRAIKVLIKIKDPYELLEEKTDEANFLMRRFNFINKQYEKLLNEGVSKAKDDDKLLIYTYAENKISLSGELSNELLYKFPDKIIIIARHHNGEMKTSFRSGKNIKIKQYLERAVKGITGRVGGHDHACGGLIKDSDWDEFINKLREELKK